VTTTLPPSPWAFATDPEPVVCRSSYVGHPLALGRLRCAVDHDEVRDPLHAADVDGQWFRWSDEMAAAAELAVGWTCLYCNTACLPQVFRGCCSSRCAFLEHDAADEYEIEVDA